MAISQLIVTPDPNATPTPTPFQPLTSSSDGTVPTRLPAGTTADTATTPTQVPLIDRLPRPDGQVNILIMGSDWRPQSGYRTDVLLLVSLNPKQGTASMLSFPRDLYVNIPGWEMQRINTAQAHGGFSLTQQTFAVNFGVHVDHYIMTNFAGFEGIVDTLGGIDVNASRNLTDKCDLPQAVKSYCSVGPGMVHMDGAEALWYVRSRYSTSDFDRTRRAQEVIFAMFDKLMSLNAIQRAPQLFQQFNSSVDTDLTLADMLPLLPLASQLFQNPNLVKRYAIGPNQVTSWVTPGGADVLVPNTDACWEVVQQALYNQ